MRVSAKQFDIYCFDIDSSKRKSIRIYSLKIARIDFRKILPSIEVAIPPLEVSYREFGPRGI